MVKYLKKIILTQEQVALVDDEDYADLIQFKWHALWAPHTQSYYAARKIRLSNGKETTEYMHRRILGLKPDDPSVDHINHETTDNQKTNMRLANYRGQGANQRNQSKYGVGIWFDVRQKQKSKPFQARAWLNGKKYHIGTFTTAEEAQAARKKWLEKYDK